MSGVEPVQRERDTARPVRRRIGMRRRLLRSKVGQWVLRHRRELLTRREIRRQPHRFDEVETCCLFIGHVKSGGSLLAAVLDAHPDTAFADEMDVVAQVEAGLDREQIFTLLLRGAQREARGGRVTARRLTPYSLAVPEQWQGGYERLRVVGDSRAGPTTRALGEDVVRLARLRAVMGETRLVFVHVVRNPYESIGAMVRRSGRSVTNAVADHRQQCRRLAELRDRIPAQDLFTLRYEDFVIDPRRHLRELLTFLDLELSESYLEACSGLVRSEPVRERDLVRWEKRDLTEVGRVIARFDFLDGYGFER
jgi:hypothetical protein